MDECMQPLEFTDSCLLTDMNMQSNEMMNIFRVKIPI